MDLSQIIESSITHILTNSLKEDSKEFDVFNDFIEFIERLDQTNENKEILEKFIEETSKWEIDFHEIILLRDVDDKIQLKLKPTYERLSKLQHSRATKKWRNSFNGSRFVYSMACWKIILGKLSFFKQEFYWN